MSFSVFINVTAGEDNGMLSVPAMGPVSIETALSFVYLPFLIDILSVKSMILPTISWVLFMQIAAINSQSKCNLMPSELISLFGKVEGYTELLVILVMTE